MAYTVMTTAALGSWVRAVLLDNIGHYKFAQTGSITWQLYMLTLMHHATLKHRHVQICYM